MIKDTLQSAGWVKPPLRSFYTHADSPDSRIVFAGRNWKHTAFGGADEVKPGIFVAKYVVVGSGRTIKSLRKHLGYWKRMLNMASGS